MRGHALAALDLAGVDAARPLGRRVGPHLVERPDEVDRRGPGLHEGAVRGIEVFPPLRRERVAVGGRDADCRRASHDHRANSVGDLGGVAAAHLDLLERQPALVEEDDGIVLEPDDPLRSEQRPAARRTWACTRRNGRR